MRELEAQLMNFSLHNLSIPANWSAEYCDQLSGTVLVSSVHLCGTRIINYFPIPALTFALSCHVFTEDTVAALLNSDLL